MPTFGTYDQVGIKEDISDVIRNISPTKTPFQTMIGTEKIKNRTHQWQEDSLRAVAVNAQVEGFDGTDNTLTATTMRDNTTQIFAGVVRVTGSADAVDTYGRDKELAYQLTKETKSLKRDLENALVGILQAKVVGTNAVARKFASYGSMIAAATTVAGGTAALTETMFNTAMQAVYDAGSDVTTFMVKPSDSVKVANFATATGRLRDIGNGREIVNAVDVLVTPFGKVKIVLNRFQKTTDALLFDPDNWKLLVLRPWFRETLAKTGDSTRILICGEFSLKHTNQAASALINALT